MPAVFVMPLFLATLPLIFLTLAPGVRLNAFYSLVPVTGVALLMQRLMADSDLGRVASSLRVRLGLGAVPRPSRGGGWIS